MMKSKIVSMDADAGTVTVEVPVKNHRSWRKFWVENDTCLVALRMSKGIESFCPLCGRTCNEEVSGR